MLTSRPPFTFTDLLHSTPGEPAFLAETRRLCAALALASLFGAVLGLRHGGLAIAVHALGVPLGILAVALLAAPAFAIVLALADAPVNAAWLARATSCAAATAGLVLAGIAPAAALFAVSVEEDGSAAVVGAAGLALAGGLAMRTFVRELAPRLDSAARGRLTRLVAMPGFLLFAASLCARIWWITLPLFREGGGAR